MAGGGRQVPATDALRAQPAGGRLSCASIPCHTPPGRTLPNHSRPCSTLPDSRDARHVVHAPGRDPRWTTCSPRRMPPPDTLMAQPTSPSTQKAQQEEKATDSQHAGGQQARRWGSGSVAAHKVGSHRHLQGVRRGKGGGKDLSVRVGNLWQG